jgi:ribonuclease VapC
MIVDASAILAILLQEPEGNQFVSAIIESPTVPRMSPVNHLEVFMRLDRIGGSQFTEPFDQLNRALAIEIAPIDMNQMQAARHAYAHYGKGKHPAGLNLGDCFAYALAKTSGEPLLFKGNDFSQTDIKVVI